MPPRPCSPQMSVLAVCPSAWHCLQTAAPRSQSRSALPLPGGPGRTSCFICPSLGNDTAALHGRETKLPLYDGSSSQAEPAASTRPVQRCPGILFQALPAPLPSVPPLRADSQARGPPAIAAAGTEVKPGFTAELPRRQRSSGTRRSGPTVQRRDRAGRCRTEAGAPTLGWGAAEQTASHIVGMRLEAGKGLIQITQAHLPLCSNLRGEKDGI